MRTHSAWHWHRVDLITKHDLTCSLYTLEWLHFLVKFWHFSKSQSQTILYEPCNGKFASQNKCSVRNSLNGRPWRNCQDLRRKSLSWKTKATDTFHFSSHWVFFFTFNGMPQQKLEISNTQVHHTCFCKQSMHTWRCFWPQCRKIALFSRHPVAWTSGVASSTATVWIHYSLLRLIGVTISGSAWYSRNTGLKCQMKFSFSTQCLLDFVNFFGKWWSLRIPWFCLQFLEVWNLWHCALVSNFWLFFESCNLIHTKSLAPHPNTMCWNMFSRTECKQFKVHCWSCLTVTKRSAEKIDLNWFNGNLAWSKSFHLNISPTTSQTWLFTIHVRMIKVIRLFAKVFAL